eukprot:m.224293 g.224293  ORF g.224293 m.224293 type:complete len:278 (-) comp16442_c0_seq1:52-885(-)
MAVAETLAAVRKLVASAQHVVILTGAGVSAESGIPTFRGAGGLWRRFAVQDLATWDAFERDPSLVWEFYHYRRDVVSRCSPNAGHHAIAAFQKHMETLGRRCTVITQNIDRLHHLAGSTNIIEMHGSLWLVKEAHPPDEDEYKYLEEPGVVWEDRTNPIVPALAGLGSPEGEQKGRLPREALPQRNGRLLRPAVVWFGEQLDQRVTSQTQDELSKCDLLLIVGTSGVVYPAAGYGRMCKLRGKPVVEFNIEDTGSPSDYQVIGPSSLTLPAALAVDP